jgi:hypothetical protein
MENPTITLLSKRSPPKGRLKQKTNDCNINCDYYQISNRRELCKYNGSWAYLISTKKEKSCPYKNKKNLTNRIK